MQLGRGRAITEAWPKEQSQEKIFFFFDNSQNDPELMGVKGETDLSSPWCTSAPAQPSQTRTCNSG